MQNVVPLLYRKKYDMATIKVLLRTSRLRKNGEYPIVLRVIQERKANFVYTNLSCPPNLWDFNLNKPSKKHPNRLELELFISQKITETQNVILKLENEQKDYSGEQILKKVKSSTKKITLFQFFDEVVNNLKQSNKIGNAKP